MRLSPVKAMPPTAEGGIARRALAQLLNAGIDPGPILREAGLTPAEMNNRQTRIPVEKQVALLGLAAAALPDELLGFHLSKEVDLREAGLLYYVLASSSTFGQALDRAERYSIVTNEGIALRRLVGPDAGICFHYVGVARHEDRHQIEFWATVLIRMARQFTGTGLSPQRVLLTHQRCTGSNELELFLGCRIDFGADRDEVAFAAHAADLPLVEADSYLHQILVGYCEEALAHRSRPAEALRTRVENAITPLLPHGTARAGEVARALGMSQRTLSRRLAEEGATFAAVFDDLRSDLARHYLQNPALSISQIAWLLGFQEVSAFTHAFKRWTGQTPTRMRSQISGMRHAGR